jgi:hypothetical protein
VDVGQPGEGLHGVIVARGRGAAVRAITSPLPPDRAEERSSAGFSIVGRLCDGSHHSLDRIRESGNYRKVLP